MPNIFAVVGGDSRQRYLAEGLAAAGHVVRTFAVPDLPDTVDNLKDTLHLARYIILPMPVLSADGTIRNSKNLPIIPAQLADYLSPNATVFGGKLDGSLPILSAAAGHTEDYANWEPLTIANIVPTAEGALQLAMEQLPTTIHGGKFLITGAGRIGMCLAMKLQALGGAVTVTARKDRDFARIHALGAAADGTKQYEKGLGQYDCIFNTVPAKVFTTEQLNQIKPGCVCIELASAPGGFPVDTGHTIISGAALPGRMSPKTAGHLILREIMHHIHTE